MKLKTEKYLSLIKRLDSSFGIYSRISSASLASLIFNYLETSDQKKELLTLFHEMLKSDQPQIRKNVVISLKIIPTHSMIEYQQDFLEMVQTISQDHLIMSKYHSIHLIEQIGINLKEVVSLLAFETETD